MQNKSKLYVICVTLFLLATMILAALPTGSCAAAITLSATTTNAGTTITVTGTGFAGSQAVGIGLGSEVPVANESHPIPSPTGTGPFVAYTNYKPVKVGSFYYHCTVSSDTNVIESNYWDSGDGTMTSDSTYAIGMYCNYVKGSVERSTSSAWDGYTVVYTVSYTHYQYGVTPTAGVTTSATGGFTASITIPSNLTTGTYAITAMDAKGGKATANLTVNGIPEGFSLGLVALLSAAVLIVSVRFFKKQPKTALLTPR